MKNWKKNIIAVILLCCLAGSVYVAVTKITGRHDQQAAEGDYITMAKTKVESFKSLAVDLKTLDLEIKKSDDNNFYYSYKVKKTEIDGKPLTCKNSGGEFSATEGRAFSQAVQKGSKGVDISLIVRIFKNDTAVTSNSSGTVTIYIPQNADLQSVELNSAIGNLRLFNLHAASGKIETDTGDVYAEDCNLANVDIITDTGDMEMNGCTLHAAAVQLSDGDISFTNGTLRGSNAIQSDAGDISLELTEKQLQDLMIQAESNSGDISVDESYGGKLSEDQDDFSQSYSSVKDEKIQIRKGKKLDMVKITSDAGDVDLITY